MALNDDGSGPREETVIDDSGGERRRAFRRRLPFGRGAVLMVGDRSHIVGVADLSTTGAYLTSRAPVAAGETHVLRLLILPSRVAVALKVEIIRVAANDHESLDHPRGVAVRFVDLDEEMRRLLATFIAREPRSKAASSAGGPS
jgi:hypothetical protein